MQNVVSRTVAVVGDIVVDHHLYAGERLKPGQLDKRGAWLVEKAGGAVGLEKLIVGLVGENWVMSASDADKEPRAHAYAVWTPLPLTRGSKELAWRGRLLGYGNGPVAQVVGTAKPSSGSEVGVIAIDDADLGYRNLSDPIASIDGSHKAWIILKTAAPVARGPLWHRIIGGAADRLICVVSADDLRRDRSAISRSLSWDRTVSDLKAALSIDPDLVALTKCRHLVVTLSSDGALWIDNPGKAVPVAKLICHATAAEGDW